MTLMIDHIRVIYMASSFADKARRERERERERERDVWYVCLCGKS